MTRDYGQVTSGREPRQQIAALHVCGQTLVIAAQDGYHGSSVRLDREAAGAFLTMLVDALCDLDMQAGEDPTIVLAGGEQTDPWQV